MEATVRTVPPTLGRFVLGLLSWSRVGLLLLVVLRCCFAYRLHMSDFSAQVARLFRVPAGRSCVVLFSTNCTCSRTSLVAHFLEVTILVAYCAKVVPLGTLVLVVILRSTFGAGERRLWVVPALVWSEGTGLAHHHVHASLALHLTLAPRTRLGSLSPFAFLSRWKIS